MKWLQKFVQDITTKVATGFLLTLGGTIFVGGAAKVVTSDLISPYVIPPEVSEWMAMVQAAAERYLAQ